MADTIAVLSQKGGTGKTTTVRTLTDVYRRSGVRTLAIDLDPAPVDWSRSDCVNQRAYVSRMLTRPAA